MSVGACGVCVCAHSSVQIVGDWTGALYKELNPDRVASGILCENIRFAKNGSPMLCALPSLWSVSGCLFLVGVYVLFVRVGCVWVVYLCCVRVRV